MLNDFIDENFCKGHTLNNFLRTLMASEVKGHFYKVVDNYVKCMYKKFRKIIITGS